MDPKPITTRIVTVDPATPDTSSIEMAAELIRAGKLVAFPTETVYGLGADAMNAQAIRSIYQAKKRPSGDPIIAHIASATQLEQLAISVPSLAYRVADAFWPGPLTLILSRAPSVPNEIAEGMATVAVRMPAHPVAKKLLQAAETPIGAPSANRFTHPSATTANHVLEDLDGRIDLILDGGPSTIGIESTVIDLTTEPRVLRPGGISLRELKSVIPGIETRVSFVGDQGVSVSPGQMLKHYSPKALLILFKGERERVLERLVEESSTAQSKGAKVGVLALDTDALDFPDAVHVERLPDDASLSGVSSALFASMRRLDAEGCDVILARDFGRAGLGEAVWDRLLRAAEGQVINVD